MLYIFKVVLKDQGLLLPEDIRSTGKNISIVTQ